MISKLPAWAEVGGFLLASIAGFINAIGFLGFHHQAVSHLTGTASLLAIELAKVQPSASLQLLGILISFMLGAMISGLLIQDISLKLGRRYGVVLAIESGLLFLAMHKLNRGADSGLYLASAACGIQNALVTTYSGAVVRTTHVTGLFTDLGILLGARLRGVQLDRRKLLMFTLLIAGFILGGVGGALAFDQWNFTALAIPATGVALLASSYWVMRIVYRK